MSQQGAPRKTCQARAKPLSWHSSAPIAAASPRRPPSATSGLHVVAAERALYISKMQEAQAGGTPFLGLLLYA